MHTVRLAGVAFAPILVRPGFVPMGLVGWCLAVSGVLPFNQEVRAVRRTQYVPFAVLACVFTLPWPLWPYRGGAIA